MEKKVETTTVLGFYRGYIGIMEKKMQTAIVSGLYRDNGMYRVTYSRVCIGIMEKKTETTIS